MSRLRIAFFLFLFAPAISAQKFSAAGTVHDATGAVIPGATIGVRPAGGDSTVYGESDAQGAFRIVLGAAGDYQVKVQASGFAPYSTTIALSSAHPDATLDIALALNTATETVEVTADALSAETTSTQLGESIGSAKMASLPLNGRSFTDLMAIQPGIVPQNTAQPGAVVMSGVASTPPSGDANPGDLSISGQRETSNGFRVNGSDVEEDVNMGTSILPNLDSIESFRVLTSNFDAEYGNSSGGQVLVTTKSGTAQWHGSAFEYLRNTDLDARNYFSQDRAAYRQNQFGGAVGGTPFHKGPALFADYQGTRLAEGLDTGDIAVPSMAEREGDFSQVASSFTTTATLADGQPCVDPATKKPCAVPTTVSGPYLAGLIGAQPGEPYYYVAGENYVVNNTVGTYAASCTSSANCVFPNGVIPQSAWSAPAKYLLSYIPQPNAGTDSFETSSQAETLTDNKGALRADWTHGKGLLTAYYFLDGYSLLNPYPTGTGGANVPGFSATSHGRAQLLSLAQTQTLGDSTLNQLHVSFMRNDNSVGQPRGGLGPSLAAQGFTGIVALQPSTVGIENVAFNDFTLGVDTTAMVQAENIYQFRESFSRISGKHGLKFGGEIHADQINTHPDVYFNGSFVFNGSETGLDFADFLLGAPSSYTQGQARNFYNRNLYMAAFAQDSFRATDRLTINYGVRWDRIRPWSEKYNQLQTLVLGEQSQVFPGAPQGLVFPGDPGVSSSLAPARNDFSPRFGLAWAPAPGGTLGKIFGPAGSTSIRAGYGMFYTAYEGLSAGIMSANPPYGYTYTSAAPPLFEAPFTVAATGANAGQRFPLKMASFGASRAHPDASVDWSQFEPLVGIPAVDSRDVTPYAEHWMLSVERQLGGSTLATVSYVGTASHHLLVLEEANPADPALCLSLAPACGPFNEQAARTLFGPQFGSVELQRTIANASYNALEASLNHRTGSLELLASYTYSKSIDQSAGLPEPVNPVDPSLSRGLSAFDLRHNFVASFDYRLPNLAHAARFRPLVAGWSIAGIARFTTGLPVTLLNNNDTSLLGTIPNGINNNGIDTPEWLGGSLGLNTNPRGGRPVFNAAQFALPALGAQGNARRRYFSGPGMEDFDATLSRDFLVKDNRALEFRAESFNLPNHAQFFGAAAVEGNISSTAFGQAISAQPPRLVQLALRYRF